MSQITRCPSCATMFKVVADQLRISDGWVRCGQCKQVFDAAAHLQAPSPAPLMQDLALDKLRPPSAARTACGACGKDLGGRGCFARTAEPGPVRTGRSVTPCGAWGDAGPGKSGCRFGGARPRCSAFSGTGTFAGAAWNRYLRQSTHAGGAPTRCLAARRARVTARGECHGDRMADHRIRWVCSAAR